MNDYQQRDLAHICIPAPNEDYEACALLWITQRGLAL